jgi:hypothetical protein
MHSYDSYGWLSAEEIPGRTTSVEPPAHGDKVVGDPYPNWTGVEWVLVAYSEPVIVPPTPAPRAPISKREFLKKFTPAEYAAIKAAANANAELDYYWQQFLLAEFIGMDDPDTINGVNLLVLVGLLTVERAAEILA